MNTILHTEWCNRDHDALDPCSSEAMTAGRVSLWLVAGPGRGTQIAVDAPQGAEVDVEEASELVLALVELMDRARRS